MNSNDTEQANKIDERKTRELCGHEHGGLRCMRPKGHRDAHEAYTATRTLNWD